MYFLTQLGFFAKLALLISNTYAMAQENNQPLHVCLAALQAKPEGQQIQPVFQDGEEHYFSSHSGKELNVPRNKYPDAIVGLFVNTVVVKSVRFVGENMERKIEKQVEFVIAYVAHQGAYAKEPHCILEPLRNFSDDNRQPVRFADGTVSNEPR